jgi:hypothetical protein
MLCGVDEHLFNAPFVCRHRSAVIETFYYAVATMAGSRSTHLLSSV